MSFWSTATTEQRLAQIDGGIECGMTSKQIAMCLGAPLYGEGAAVRSFANRHGRLFPTPQSVSTSRGGNTGGRIGGLVTARRRGRPEIEAGGAFELFPQDHEENPFTFLSEEAGNV